MVEKLLAIADAEAKLAIDQLAAQVLFPPSRADRLSIGVWLGLLRVRDPYTRRTTEAMADSAFKMQLSLINSLDDARAYLRGEANDEPDDDLVEALFEAAQDMDSWEVSPSPSYLVHHMLDSGLRTTPFFAGRLFSVLRFPEPGLVLCDRPVVLFQDRWNRQPLRSVGPATADEIWLALDRQTALILHNNATVGEVIIDAPPGHTVNDFNQATVLCATSAIYCHPDDLPRLDALKLPDAGQPLLEASGGAWMTANPDGVNAAPTRERHHRYRRS